MRYKKLCATCHSDRGMMSPLYCPECERINHPYLTRILLTPRAREQRIHRVLGMMALASVLTGLLVLVLL